MTEYLTLSVVLRQKILDLLRLVERIESLLQKSNVSKDDDYIDAVALHLQGFYTTVEQMMEAIASAFSEGLPAGKSWHQNLLIQMSVAIPDVRPAVISQETRQSLDEYRSFRHVVRNVYTLNLRLDPPQPPLNNGGEEQAGSFLGDRYPLRTISSLQILSYCQSREAIANPQYATVENATNDLPFAGFEGEQVAQIFNIPRDRRLKGQTEATPENYRRLLKNNNSILSSHHNGKPIRKAIAQYLDQQLEILGDAPEQFGDRLKLEAIKAQIPKLAKQENPFNPPFYWAGFIAQGLA